MDGAFFEFIVADHYVYYILYRRMNEFSREKNAERRMVCG